jgi:hypothetical protein
VPDLRTEVIALLRTHFSEEAAAGFPHLKCIPQTKVIQFLDYFANISKADQAALLDALALRAETHFFAIQDRVFPRLPAFDCYWQAITSLGPFFGGYRYTGVKMMNSVAKCKEEGGLEGFMKNSSGLALQPRPDLLPDLRYLIPAKAPLLRKLLDAALKRHGFVRDKGVRGGQLKYNGPSGATFWPDFGSRMGQLCYGVSIRRDGIKVVRVSYELLWGQPGGWDYLTEENAERSINLLPELVGDVIHLAEEVQGRIRRGA